MRLGLLLCMITFPAFAETPIPPNPMTAAEFEAHIGTDTLTYGYSSGDRGTADYGPGRSLQWAFEGQPCFSGTWFPRHDEICFAFEDGRLSACWQFYKGPDGLQGVATFRASGNTSSELTAGDVRLDTRSGRVTLAGEPVKLTAQEYKLLSYLMHHKGKVVSRTELIEHIYDQDFDRDSNTIEVFVTRIRKKLGADVITTIRGLGYSLDDPADQPRA